jgi:hypothetical protein
VDNMQGSIEVKNIDNGAKFTIKLPSKLWVITNILNDKLNL